MMASDDVLAHLDATCERPLAELVDVASIALREGLQAWARCWTLLAEARA